MTGSLECNTARGRGSNACTCERMRCREARVVPTAFQDHMSRNFCRYRNTNCDSAGIYAVAVSRGKIHATKSILDSNLDCGRLGDRGDKGALKGDAVCMPLATADDSGGDM